MRRTGGARCLPLVVSARNDGLLPWKKGRLTFAPLLSMQLVHRNAVAVLVRLFNWTDWTGAESAGVGARGTLGAGARVPHLTP